MGAKEKTSIFGVFLVNLGLGYLGLIWGVGTWGHKCAWWLPWMWIVYDEVGDWILVKI